MTETESPDISGTSTIVSERPIKNKPYPDLKGTVILFFVTVGYMILISIPFIIIRLGPGATIQKSASVKSLLDLLAYIASLSPTLWYAIKRSKGQGNRLAGIKLTKIEPWLVPTIILGALALIIPVAQTVSWIPMPPSVQKMFENALTKDVFSIGMAVIFAPVIEETLCRGIVLRGLLKNYAPGKAIVISALFFAAIHLNPWQAIPAFFGGLFLGWVYYKTQSVTPCIIIHATINATASAFLFLPVKQQDFLSLFGMPGYLLVVSVSIIVFVSVCFVIQRRVSAV